MKSLTLFIVLISCSYGCKVIEEKGYNCVSGDCVAVFENPQYHTLEDCLTSCGDTGTSGYRCINGNCVAVNSDAEYKTFAECQKNCDNSNSSTGATITFVVYQRCNGVLAGNSSSPASFLNGAKIDLATSQSNLNDKVFFHFVITNDYGKATINELTPRTYYYQIVGVVCTSKAVRSRTGSITLKAGDNIERRIDLY